MKALRAVWSSAAATIVVVTSSVALAFSAWPALRPDPRDVLAANLDVETVEPAVTLHEYLKLSGRRLQGATATPSDLRTHGYVVYLHLQIQGRKHANLELHQVLYRASTHRRIRDQGPTRDGFFHADTPNDEWITQVWVPNPPYDFAVFVRLELFDHGSLMAMADTGPLRVAP